MLFQICTAAGNLIVEASCTHEAKLKAKERFSSGTQYMKATKIEVEYPETIYQPGCDEEKLKQLEGRDLVIFDSHHMSAVRIRKATAAVLDYYLDEYSTIIIL